MPISLPDYRTVRVYTIMIYISKVFKSGLIL